MPPAGPWIVDLDEAAVRDFEAVKGRGAPRGLNAVDKLRQLGPKLVAPHVKSLKGEADLLELRPRQGNSKCRPNFVQLDGRYLVLAVASDHAKDMDAAIVDARARLQARR